MVKRGGFLRPWEAARYLGIQVDKVYEMLEAGELPGEKVDERWRLDMSKLDAWLDEAVSPAELKALAKRLKVPQDKVAEFFRKSKPKPESD